MFVCARVLGDEVVGTRRRGVCELGRVLVRGRRRAARRHAERRRSPRARAAASTISLSSLREPLAGLPDPAQELLVLGRRPESEAGRERSMPESVRRRSRPPGRQPGRPGSRSSVSPEDLVEVAIDVLGEQEANVAGVAPELAVCGGPLLERPERLHPLVGLPEESEAEHSHDDDEQGRAHERDEQLDVDAAGTRPTARTSGLSAGLSSRRFEAPAALSCCATASLRHVLRSSAPRAAHEVRDQPLAVDLRDVEIAGRVLCDLSVSTSMK